MPRSYFRGHIRAPALAVQPPNVPTEKKEVASLPKKKKRRADLGNVTGKKIKYATLEENPAKCPLCSIVSGTEYRGHDDKPQSLNSVLDQNGSRRLLHTECFTYSPGVSMTGDGPANYVFEGIDAERARSTITICTVCNGTDSFIHYAFSEYSQTTFFLPFCGQNLEGTMAVITSVVVELYIYLVESRVDFFLS